MFSKQKCKPKFNTKAQLDKVDAASEENEYVHLEMLIGIFDW